MTEKKKMERMTRLSNVQNARGTAEGFLDDDQNEPDEIIDEEELMKLKTMKDLKRQYREAFNELKDLKSEAIFSQNAIDSAKNQLVGDFEGWYHDTFQDANAKQPTMTPTMSASGMGMSPKKGSSSPKKGATGSKYRDPAMDEDMEEDEDEREGIDMDKDALKYIRSRQNVKTLAAARKIDRN